MDLIRVDRLITEDIAGIITQEDKDYLQIAITTNEEAYKLWKRKRAMLCTPEVTESIKNAANVERIFGDKHNNKNAIFITLLSMAAIFIVGITLYLYKPEKPAVPLLTTTKNIQLQLPGGQIVDLSDTKGQAQAGNVLLNNTNKLLTYSSQHTSIVQWATLTVPRGKDYKINLSDGSEVWMNADTKLKFPLNFSDTTREITIDGEAYVKVSKNARQPFIVHLPGGTVQVLGTEFNVNSYDTSNTRVSLVNGIVQVKTTTANLVIKPGKEVRLDPITGQLHLQSFNEDYTLSWRKGIYAFRNSSLSEVLQVLPRWFDVSLKIDDPKFAQKRFTGIIDRNLPIEQSLDILKKTNDFDYSLKDGEVRIFQPH